jgi:hypothetical protein
MYGTAEGFAAYHESRGREIPGTWSDDTIEAALLSASEWIDSIYGPSFIGHKTDGFEQENEWPRTNAVVMDSTPAYVYDTDAIPARVTKAAYEAAWRQATTPGSLLVDYTPGKYKSVSIDGALSVEYRQFDSAYEVQVQIGAVDTLLWPLLDMSSGGKTSTLSGAASRV